MAAYKKRIADALLKKRLERIGAVLIEGPKWCGKTTTAEHQANTKVYLDDPSNKDQIQGLRQVGIDYLLQGKTPVLLDEWQLAPELWDAVRFTVDHREGVGQFILTGSAVPIETDLIHHTGTGRFSWLRMRSMSLYESGESNGEVSLRELFKHPDKLQGKNDLKLEDIAFLICRGGWPQAAIADEDGALGLSREYYDAIVNNDISRADGIKKNPDRAMRLMRSLARLQGSAVSNSTIAEDMKVNDSAQEDRKTVACYLEALKKIFVIEDMTAWLPNLRSRTAIRTSDTRYFTDPSIATAALGVGPSGLIKDLNTMGFLFETLCVRDLRVYADAIDGRVYHYRDKNGLECDAVVQLRNGSYGMVEIKLGGSKWIDEGSENLKKLAGLINTEKYGAPSFMMVLTAVGQWAYRRQDDVYVVPIGCLKD